MFAAIHFLSRKEALKLRPYFGLLLLSNILIMVYLYLDLRHRFQVEHAEMLFYQANRIGRVFYGNLKFVPLMTGVALALAQFVPEVSKGRLRLSMHLPVSVTVLALTYVSIGIGVLCFILMINLGALYFSVGAFFPEEFAYSSLITAFPWALSGVVAYLGTAMTMLEPARIRQVFNLVVAVGLIWLCHAYTAYGVYAPILLGVVLAVVLLIPAFILPMYRFRDGGR